LAKRYNVTPPHGESLKDTFKRVVLYYVVEIELKLKSGQAVLVVAHGNSLRALMMYLEGITATEIEDVMSRHVFHMCIILLLK
jgi:2,3-bisphosphoglycerate-dependent phosphoglycerate mutase